MSEEIKLLSRNPAHFIRQESFSKFWFGRDLRSMSIRESLPSGLEPSRTVQFWSVDSSQVIFEKLKKTKTELHPISRNVKSHVNPFEVVREYQRALNATKLERVFAKPFVGSLEGHTDGVSIITKNPLKLNRPGIYGQ